MRSDGQSYFRIEFWVTEVHGETEAPTFAEMRIDPETAQASWWLSKDGTERHVSEQVSPFAFMDCFGRFVDVVQELTEERLPMFLLETIAKAVQAENARAEKASQN